MSDDDRARWDARHAEREPPTVADVVLPARFAADVDAFPTSGHALDVACGTGSLAVWLARRGLDVVGVDVSPVAVARAEDLAARAGTADRCRFVVHDLDAGLPDGPPVDVLLCHRFHDPRLTDAVVGRLAPGGLLAVVARSEVGAAPGRFRARPGELFDAYAGLTVLDAGEADGEAWLLARLPVS